MKNLPGIIALSILLAMLTSAKSLLANTPTPLAQNREIDEPFCYMKTPDGKTVDLGKLCEQKPASRTSPSCISGSNIAKSVLIANVNYEGNFLSGKIVNQSCKVVQNIKVNYEVLDESDNLIDNGFISVQPVAVEPGKSAIFRGEVISGAKVVATHLDFKF